MLDAHHEVVLLFALAAEEHLTESTGVDRGLLEVVADTRSVRHRGDWAQRRSPAIVAHNLNYGSTPAMACTPCNCNTIIFGIQSRRSERVKGKLAAQQSVAVSTNVCELLNRLGLC